MNREILFKAKRLDNGEWVEGYYRADPDLNNHFICGWNYYLSENGLERELFEYEINSGTLCQYTGLTDKNGQKIWENDMLGHIFNRVEFVDGAYCVNGDRPLCFIAKECKVIGNIFDDPELLEVEG